MRPPLDVMRVYWHFRTMLFRSLYISGIAQLLRLLSWSECQSQRQQRPDVQVNDQPPPAALFTLALQAGCAATGALALEGSVVYRRERRLPRGFHLGLQLHTHRLNSPSPVFTCSVRLSVSRLYCSASARCKAADAGAIRTRPLLRRQGKLGMVVMYYCSRS